jgi:gamma-glutamylcyclotransferase (GGCT)/AIG2-like uncharacterized protein YtfP
MKINEIARKLDYQLINDIKECPYYFAYGMNTNAANMTSRTLTSVDLGACILPNFSLEFKYYCDVVPTPGKSMLGVLWKMSPEGLALLDVREGYPTHYDRQIMRIAGHRKTQLAWVYFMTANYGAQLEPPPDHYWQDVNHGYKEHGLPTKQLDLALDRAWDAYEKQGGNPNYNHDDEDPLGNLGQYSAR